MGETDEIKARLPLHEIVGRTVRLVRRGRLYEGLCPFHQEKTPSFKVDDQRGYYRCYGCGANGDHFTFLMETSGMGFREALEALAGEAGVTLAPPEPGARARAEERASLYDVMEMAAAYFEAELAGPRGAGARAYLAGRDLDADVIAQFRLGYAPGGGGLIRHLKEKGVQPDQMAALGLTTAREDGTLRDLFWERVMFPIADGRGRVIAFGARALKPDAKPKYLNSPATPLFDKSATLYNLGPAREAARKAGTLIVAEGYMDVIALARAGFAHAVAPLGTALTEGHLDALWRIAPEPILCLDGDAAGQRAAYRAADLALPGLEPGRSLRFAALPPGLDPDDLLRRDGPGALGAALDAAKPLADVLWVRETRERDLSTPERRAGLEADLRSAVRRIAHPDVRAHYDRDLRERLRALFTPLSGPRGPRRFPPGRGRPEPAGVTGAAAASRAALRARGGGSGAAARRELLDRLLLHAALNHPMILEAHAEDVAALSPGEPAFLRLRDGALSVLAEAPAGLDRAALLDHLARMGLADACRRLAASCEGRGRFADGAAAQHDAEAGFAAALRERRAAELAEEFELARAEWQKTRSDEAWARVGEIQRLIREASGVYQDDSTPG